MIARESVVGFVNTWVHGQSTESNIHSKLGRNVLSSISVKCGNTTKYQKTEMRLSELV